MARALLRFKKPDTVFWVQDYHFLALGAELRDLGVTQPTGFSFTRHGLHARSWKEASPSRIGRAMLAYDLIGFQTEDDCENFLGYLSADLGLAIQDGVVTSRYGTSRISVFPIGIDPRNSRNRLPRLCPIRCVAVAAQPERREAGDRC